MWIQLFTLMRIHIQLLFKMPGIFDHWSIDALGLNFEPLGLHFEHPRLYFEPLQLLNFDFNAYPDPAFHSNADPDSASKNNEAPSGSATLL
jgi:hypothetical protein